MWVLCVRVPDICHVIDEHKMGKLPVRLGNWLISGTASGLAQSKSIFAAAIPANGLALPVTSIAAAVSRNAFYLTPNGPKALRKMISRQHFGTVRTSHLINHKYLPYLQHLFVLVFHIKYYMESDKMVISQPEEALQTRRRPA